MKYVKHSLTALIVTVAIGSAFATKPMANRNVYTKSDGTCNLIFCRTSNIENQGLCLNTHTKYTDNTCTSVYEGQTWWVFLP